MVKVSIVVPVYNVEDYLEKCLLSIVNQTLTDIEIIVVIDGSSDNSLKIARAFAEQYPQKVKVYEKPNGGLSDARNFGLQFCKGEYIGFIDSDDYIENTMYEKLYTEAREKACDIVSCDYYVEYSETDKRVVSGKIATDKKERYIDMKAAAWNKLYSASLLQNSNVLFPVGLIYEDTNFFLKLLLHAERCGYVNIPMVHYIQRNNSIAHTQGKKVAQIFDIFDDVIKYYKEQNQFENYKTEIEYAVTRVLLGSSLLRVSHIDDKTLRDQLSEKTIQYLDTVFPEWKSNKYLKQCNGANGIIMKIANIKSIRIITLLLHHLRKRI